MCLDGKIIADDQGSGNPDTRTEISSNIASPSRSGS
jgi:hypothetical protein